MHAKEKPASKPADKPFIITRSFDAPRDLVFRVWTEEKHLLNWWGPKGFTVKQAKNDLRQGGVMHYCLLTPDAQEMWGKWVYREIVKPEKLVFIDCFSDAKGGVTRHPMSQNWPLEMLTMITFTERNGKTEITVQWEAYNASEAEREVFNSSHTSMKNGWGGTFDQLEAYLAGQTSDEQLPSHTFVRTLNAPRELVFRMWTDPKHFAKWFGPDHFTNPLCEMDIQVGGKIAVDMKSPDGEVFPNRGEFVEIDPPRRLVFTLSVMDHSGNSLLTTLNSITLEENGGKTTMTVNARVVRVVPEAIPFTEGMKEGWTQTLDRFQSHLAANA